MKYRILGLMLFFLTVPSLMVQPAPSRPNGYTAYSQVLAQHVSGGGVNYEALLSNPKNLNDFLDLTSQVPRDHYEEWNPQERMAFLINLYNAQTLKLIIDHYPIESIKKIRNLYRGPWDRKYISLFGETVSLDDIEHRMLRRFFREPRIHFALVCASEGCPPLRDEPYEGAKLEDQLNEQARIFLADTQKNYVAPDEKRVYLSPIFKWFKKDFGKKREKVLASLQPFWPEPEELDAGYLDYKIKYTHYSWKINDRK